MMLCAFVFFLYGQSMLPDEFDMQENSCEAFQGQWNQVMEDGTREPVEVPGNCQAKKGQWITVETVLPQTEEAVWFCFRSMQQR